MGIAASTTLRKRVRLWDAWTVLLQRLHRELRYSAMPFGRLLAIVPKDDLTVLSWLSDWNEEADLSCVPSVSAEEEPFARAFFAGLGISDLEGQLAHIEQYIARAEEAKAAALDVYRRCAKAYATTGICAGLGIGVWLI